MFSNTVKRSFVTAAIIGGLVCATVPAGASAAAPNGGLGGTPHAVSDGTSNTIMFAEAARRDGGHSPSGFSWSETQTGTAAIAGAQANLGAFVVDGPLTVQPASSFSWSEHQTGSAS